MKVSLEERFRIKTVRFGRKNKACRVIAVLALAVGLAVIRAGMYFKGNGKRFSVIAMTFLLCAVYSSFSSAGLSGNGGYGLKPISDEAQNIAFSEETYIDFDELERLHGGTRLPEEYYVDGGFSEDTAAQAGISGAGQEDREPPKQEELSEETFSFSADDWRLTLVNPQHPIPEDYEVRLGDVYTIRGMNQCDERIIDDWLAMQKAATRDGVPVFICSTYRDTEFQRMLFNKSITVYINMGLSYLESYQRSSDYTNVPDGSEHQLGLALDIIGSGVSTLETDFENTPAGKWLAANSYRYGFILRYPRGKEFITGVEYEPWHFRYVGVEAAAFITERGITLEEFWEEYL